MDRDELTDWIYNALKEIQTEEDIMLSDTAFIADHLAPKLQALIPDIEAAKQEVAREFIEEIEENSTRDDKAGWLDYVGNWAKFKSRYLGNKGG